MNIQHQVQLQPFNTLHLSATATHYVHVKTLNDVIDALAYAEQQRLNVLILSGGSNMLLPQQIDALVLHMAIQGIEILADDAFSSMVRVGAGQVWHDFVQWTTEQQLIGLQNLALIPGLVGASPVQNIGAYGVEVGEFIQFVEVYDRVEKHVKLIAAPDCQFSYRHSIFKDEPARYVILYVHFKLPKQAELKLHYGDLQQAVGDDKTVENLQYQVIHIRQQKLPDPHEFPNVGSFFKNPMISESAFAQLIAQYPQLPHYPQANGQMKIAAGWLIDQVGWKGKRLGVVGMFAKQALVLVNYADATLDDVQITYRAVQQDVLNTFHILLEPEPILFNHKGLICSHME